MSDAGFADCWWSQSSAAESKLDAAEEWRAESRRSLSQRVLHCKLFSLLQEENIGAFNGISISNHIMMEYCQDSLNLRSFG